jgi:hypothetical protein
LLKPPEERLVITELLAHRWMVRRVSAGDDAAVVKVSRSANVH